MRELIRQNLSSFTEFQNEAGLFDEAKLNEFIANLRDIAPEPSFLGNSPINYEAWTNYENDISSGGKYQTYFNMVKAGLHGMGISAAEGTAKGPGGRLSGADESARPITRLIKHRT